VIVVVLIVLLLPVPPPLLLLMLLLLLLLILLLLEASQLSLMLTNLTSSNYYVFYYYWVKTTSKLLCYVTFSRTIYMAKEFAYSIVISSSYCIHILIQLFEIVKFVKIIGVLFCNSLWSLIFISKSCVQN